MKIVFTVLIITCSIFMNHLTAQDMVINWGDYWNYYDAGNQPSAQSSGAEWYDLDYDDSLWQSDVGHFGYGDNDEATETQAAFTLYFRKEFTLTDGSIYLDVDANLIYDDGAVIYLNGTELNRINMPAGNIDYNTFAITYTENELSLESYPAQLLTGKNVIAVEVHQATSTSSDISFNLQLKVNKDSFVGIKRGPYLQKGAPNTITIRWRTTRATESVIYYGINSNALNQTESDLDLKTEHEIIINNLQADTKYYYEIRNSDGVIKADPGMYFKTAPPVGQRQPVTAWILGDCGMWSNKQRSVRDAFYNYIGNEHTDMMLFLGDNAYWDGSDGDYQYGMFQNMYEDKLKNTVAWSARGNHERYDYVTQTVPYYDIFSFPTNGECGGLASGTEAYYAFDYANIHFIVLDSYDTSRDVGATMYNWCEADIQNTTAEWIVALWHHPPYTKGSHDSDTEIQLIEMRENFLPMLEENGVDLVLSGHSHSYERSYFLNGHYGPSNTFDMNNNTIGDNGDGSGSLSNNVPYQKNMFGADAGKGTVYITAGNAGKTSGGPLNHQAMYYSVNELGSCVLEVNQDTMHVKFLRETGLVEDYFSIIKAACESGTVCNDGDDCTINDKFDVNCNCVGVFQDADNDGLCDAEECAVVLSIENTIPTNTYQAANQIFSDGEVLSQDSVFFKAANLIRLESNFSVKAGARFSASNEGCD